MGKIRKHKHRDPMIQKVAGGSPSQQASGILTPVRESMSMSTIQKDIPLEEYFREHQQTPLGIFSFDVPCLCVSVQECARQMQSKIQKERESMLAEMSRDPVPQFNHAQIDAATQFLAGAMHTMQAFTDEFRPDSLKHIDGDTLKMMQEKCRESARKLVLLFGDSSATFSGSNMQGTTPRSQKRVRALQLFLSTFGKAQWLGQSVVTEDFVKNQKLVVDLLGAFLSPSKIKLPSSAPRHAPNPPQYVQGKEQGHIDDLHCLGELCKKLAEIFREDSQKRADMQLSLTTKMDKLKSFVDVLNHVPEVLNRYVLVRLADVEGQDLAVLKKWITHAEATQVEKMLEAFRDEATYERATRDQASRSSTSWQFAGSDGVASGKAYLFAKSIDDLGSDYTEEDADSNGEDHAHDARDEPAISNVEGNPCASDPKTHRPGHRQLKRRAKYWASMPRTPSSATGQS
jgi:hypothetical protein